MKKILLMLSVLCAGAAFAQEAPEAAEPVNMSPVPAKASMKEIIAEMLESAVPESVKYNYDENKQIKSIIFYVEVPLRKGLPANIAKTQGAKDCKMAANTFFTQLLNTSFEVKEDSEGHIATFVKGEAGGEDAGSSTTSSAYSNVSSEKKSSFSKAALAGISSEAVNPNNGGSYGAVYSWSAQRTAALSGVSKKMATTAAGSASDAAAVDVARTRPSQDVLDASSGKGRGGAAASGAAAAAGRASGGNNGEVKGGASISSFGGDDL